ncbi:MAG TPA: hypothetical protein VFH80_34400 [Solirubrobacteraceae bacterium]|nr:hypothetical protein [Solirubrobacteraceae bacterium]
MGHDQDRQPNRDGRSFLIAILIVAVVITMVVLHLTGIVGPGSH